MIEQIIFRNISWINRTSYDQFSSHGTTVDDFNKIDEVLLCFKASNKLCMIWRPGGGKKHRNQLTVINESSVGSLCAHLLCLHLAVVSDKPTIKVYLLFGCNPAFIFSYMY